MDSELAAPPWRKAKRSQANGNCVEVATWRKASRSQGNGACVEAGVAEPGHVLVRDTTNRDGATLAFGTSAWEKFIATLQ